MKSETNAAASHSTVNPEIMAKLDRWCEMIKEKSTALKIAAEMYWPEAMMNGEGAPKTFRGLVEIEPFFAAIATGGLDGKFVVTDPAVTSGSLSTIFTQMTIKGGGGNPDFVSAALMVWEKRGSDWKIIRETFLNAPLN